MRKNMIMIMMVFCDGEDAYPAINKGSINYIFYVDSEGVTGDGGPYEEYISYFSDHHKKYESFEIGNSDRYGNSRFDMFIYNYQMMTMRFDAANKLKHEYTHVDNLIIILHGYNQAPFWFLHMNDDNEGDEIFTLNNMNDLLKYTPCHIKNVDLQMCYAGLKWDSYEGINYYNESFATILAKNSNIDYVYSSEYTIGFDSKKNVNVTPSSSVYFLQLGKEFKLNYVKNGTLQEEKLGHTLGLVYRKY